MSSPAAGRPGPQQEFLTASMVTTGITLAGLFRSRVT